MFLCHANKVVEDVQKLEQRVVEQESVIHTLLGRYVDLDKPRMHRYRRNGYEYTITIKEVRDRGNDNRGSECQQVRSSCP